MHWDSDLGLWNSFSISLLIFFRDLICLAAAVAFHFMYHVRVLSLKVVSGCAIFDASSVILFTDHIASHVNQCCSTSSLSVPWNTGNLRTIPIHHPWSRTMSSRLTTWGRGSRYWYSFQRSSTDFVYFTCRFSSFLSYSYFYSNHRDVCCSFFLATNVQGWCLRGNSSMGYGLGLIRATIYRFYGLRVGGIELGLGFMG